ncbi:MAG: hypothetical protein U0992_09420 [Planctomycetaceae bacterium]
MSAGTQTIRTSPLKLATEGPTVILVCGVNGVGKPPPSPNSPTTCNAGKKVVLAAGDTFRATAVEQLTMWSAAAEVREIVTKPSGTDPAAVAFEGVDRAILSMRTWQLSTRPAGSERTRT